MADGFVRVRLTRIDDCDLNLFEFDYDLTIVVFFLNAEKKVYARYGGRDAKNADNRQSLDGLRYTMQSVLDMHESEKKRFAPRTEPQRLFARDVTGWYGGGCLHCHQVQEAINDKLKRDGNWQRDRVWRYPMPENIGLRLEVDRGNVVDRVLPGTLATRAGIQPGDKLEQLGPVPIHSFADVQFALDKAPASGALDAVWLRGDEQFQATLDLPDDWKKGDITWRASVRWRYVASLPLSGDDLTADERGPLGLSDSQLAFRAARLKPAASAAGIQEGDLIVAINGQPLHMTASEFRQYVRHQFVVGDTIQFTIRRGDQRLVIPLVLGNQ